MKFDGKLFEKSIINEIKIREVYEYFDQPILFSFYNELDALFLAFLLSENNSMATWLYLGVSHRDLIRLENNKIRIREFMDSLNDQICYISEIDYINEKNMFYITNLNKIDKSYLPDFSYELPEKEKDSLIEWSIDDESIIKNNTYVLDLRLFLDNDPKKHTIEVDVFGRLLNLIQELIYSFALPKDAKINSKYSKENRENNKALLVCTSPGSFKLRIESEKTVSLLGDDPFAKASIELIKLFDNYDNEDLIANVFKNNNEKSNRKLTEIIYNLKGNNIAGELIFAQPFGSSVSSLTSNFDKSKLITIIDKLKDSKPDQSKLTVNGTLEAVDGIHMRFTIIDNEGKSFNGNIDKIFYDEIIEKVKFTIPSYGSAKLLVKKEVFKISDQSSEKYILIDWNEEK